MATRSGTPAQIMFRTAVRRRSWEIAGFRTRAIGIGAQTVRNRCSDYPGIRKQSEGNPPPRPTVSAKVLDLPSTSVSRWAREDSNNTSQHGVHRISVIRDGLGVSQGFEPYAEKKDQFSLAFSALLHD